MNITTFNLVFPKLLEIKATPWIWGRHAVGKTETVENWYATRGFKFFNIRLNTQSDLGDILGLQEFTTDSVTGQKIATKFCYPDWITDLISWCQENPAKRGCIFIDEVNRAARLEMIGPIFQMSLDCRLHTLVFPNNLDVILASNPDTKDYSLLSLSDKALMSRFWHVHFNPSKEEFLVFAEKEKISNKILYFLKEQPSFIEEETEAFSIDTYATPDRRKWIRYIDKLLKMEDFPKQGLSETIAGFVGFKASIAFETWLESEDKPIDLKDLLKSYKTKVKPVIQELIQKNRMDKINDVCDKLCKHVADDLDLSEKEITNCADFINDLPSDYMFRVMNTCFKKIKFHNAMNSIQTKVPFVQSIEEKLKEIYDATHTKKEENKAV